MMKVKAITMSVCVFFSLSFISCTDKLFPEKEWTKGFLRANISEEGAFPSTTEEIQVRYYDLYSGDEYTDKFGEPDYFDGENNFLSKIKTGEYRFLAYSAFNGKVRNTSDIATIEVYMDTTYLAKYDSYVIANKQKPVFTATETGKIHREDTTYRSFVLTPMVQNITVNVTVMGLSNNHHIKSIEAMLSGVIVGRKIHTNQPIPEYSGLICNFDEIQQDKFTSSSWVFGVSNAVPNIFKIQCIGDSFNHYSEVELSDVLTDFTADGMIINLVIELGENMEMKDIYIADWEDVDQSEIKF
ncbi:hypothetical protein [Bacteroides sp. 51]|uniref:hypothetical protein n=1 Tax=Bacteroides sp. 51 TaxID=2302938 RepID=UPI0013D2C631|nr:hypothetical protein [Bacteroides sp. 51]NDV83430.1 hypothetical protein [Bacteroides sp. 51]